MILTCPSCTAQFMVSSEALGSEGREVRCGKCGHMWFQAGERDSLDELPSVEEPEEDIIVGFEQHVEKAEPIPEVLRPKPQVITDGPVSARKKQIIGALAGLILVSILFLAFVALKETLGRSTPFLGAAYEKMGFHLEKDEASIAIDRLKVNKDGSKILASMYLINLTSDDVPVKKITADLTDMDYKTLKSIDIEVPDTTIKGESQSKVDFSFDNAPKDAVSVRVRLSQK